MPLETDKLRRQSLLWLASIMTMEQARAAIPNPNNLPGTQPPVGSSKPYESITPPVTADRNIVRFFFSYNCPHCRNYHNGIVRWGESLPSPLKFVSTPILNSPDDDSIITCIFARLIGETIAPKSLSAYDFEIYSLVQGDPYGSGPASSVSVNDALAALVRAGVPPEKIKAFIERSEIKKIEAKIMDNAKIIKTYSIKVTPSVAISGRFLVTPDHVNGNAQQFGALLNGIISRILEGGSHAIGL